MPCFGNPTCKDLHGVRLRFDYSGGKFDQSFYGNDNNGVHFGAAEGWYVTGQGKNPVGNPGQMQQGYMTIPSFGGIAQNFTFRDVDRDPTSIYKLVSRPYKYVGSWNSMTYIWSVQRQSSQCHGAKINDFPGAWVEHTFSISYRLASGIGIAVWDSRNQLKLDSSTYPGIQRAKIECIPCPPGQHWAGDCCCDPCVEKNISAIQGIREYLEGLNGRT